MNYSNLRTQILASIKYPPKITAQALQEQLINIVNGLDLGALLLGVATPSSTPNTEANGFYFGLQPGTYTNFPNINGETITVDSSEVAIIVRSGNYWSKIHITTYPTIDPTTKHWMIGNEDTGVLAEGTDGVTPHIDPETGNWFIGTTNTGIHAQGAPGADAVNPFKGWYDADITGEAGSKVVDDTANLPANPVVGDYAYVKTLEISGTAPSQTETPVVKIYECTTAGTWSDSGRTADTTNVQTFADGQKVNEVHIVNNFTTGGSNNVASAETVKTLNERTKNIKQDEQETNEDSIIITTNNGTVVGKIDSNGADFSVIKENGVRVATQNDVEQLNGEVAEINETIEEKTKKISNTTSTEDIEGGEEIAFVNESDDEKVAKVNKNGVFAKHFFYNNGKKIDYAQNKDIIPYLSLNLDVLTDNAKLELLGNEDTIIAIMGDSIWAGVGPSVFSADVAKYLPPNMCNGLPAYWMYQVGVKNKPYWYRYDTGIFTEVGTFTTEVDKFNTNSGKHESDAKSNAYTRQSDSTNASVSYTWDLDDFEKMLFVHRLRFDGVADVQITISGGNGKVLVKHNGYINPINGVEDNAWVEANNYTFTQQIDNSHGTGQHNGTSSFANFNTYFKKVDGATGSVTVTFSRIDNDATKYFYYWGAAFWNGKTVILDNVARAGGNMDILIGHIQDDVNWRHPNLIMLEVPIVNSVNAGDTTNGFTPQVLNDEFEAMLFNTGNCANGTAHLFGASFADNNLSAWASNGKVIYLIPNHFRNHFESDSNRFKPHCPWGGTEESPTGYYKENADMLWDIFRRMLLSHDLEYIDYSQVLLNLADRRGISWYNLLYPISDDSVDCVTVDRIHPNNFGAEIQGTLIGLSMNL